PRPDPAPPADRPPAALTNPHATTPPPATPFSPFLFNPPPTTAIYTLSLHDALPICFLELAQRLADQLDAVSVADAHCVDQLLNLDRKSTRLNSSHRTISYAVFCLKKKSSRTSLLRASSERFVAPASVRPGQRCRDLP